MGEPVKINRWLLPLSYLYGLGVRLRNRLFDWKVKKSRRFDLPVICIGNLAVGGTGKTPHTEYLAGLLREHYRVAVLSRGYKRKTTGYIEVETACNAGIAGDEPCQIKRKFPDVTVAVDKERRPGIGRLMEKL